MTVTFRAYPALCHQVGGGDRVNIWMPSVLAWTIYQRGTRTALTSNDLTLRALAHDAINDLDATCVHVDDDGPNLWCVDPQPIWALLEHRDVQAAFDDRERRYAGIARQLLLEHFPHLPGDTTGATA